MRVATVSKTAAASRPYTIRTNRIPFDSLVTFTDVLVLGLSDKALIMRQGSFIDDELENSEDGVSSTSSGAELSSKSSGAALVPNDIVVFC